MRILCLFLFIFVPFYVYSYESENYFIELGKKYLEEDNIYQAEIEFRKALFIDSGNKEVKEYLDKIRKKKIKKALDLFSEIPPEKEIFFKREKKIKKEKKVLASQWKLKGSYQISLGATSEDIIWKRANWDLNEKDWRLLSTENFNNCLLYTSPSPRD